MLVASLEWAVAAAPGGAEGLGTGGGAIVGVSVATAALGTAAAFTTGGTAAYEASPGLTAAECPAADASPSVCGVAVAEGTGK